MPPSKARELAASGPLDSFRKRALPKRKQALDRTAMFKIKDTNKDGKMTLEEYLKNFPDEAEGRRRFPTFDSNKDGVLSEEEFVTFKQSES